MIVDKIYNPGQIKVIVDQVLDMTLRIALLEQLLLTDATQAMYDISLKQAHIDYSALMKAKLKELGIEE